MVDMSMLVNLIHRVIGDLAEPFRSHPWQIIFLCGQIATGLIAVNWWIHRQHLPNPGVAVALIAFVAAAMSIHPDMRGWQKGVWMLIIGVLLIVETRAIAKDREENNTSVAADRKAQNDNFAKIRTEQERAFRDTADGLKSAIAQSQQQFDRTMSKSDQIVTEASAIAKLSRRNIDAATGGESYAVVWLGEVINDEASFMLIHKGDYALRSLRLNFTDRAETDRVVTRASPPPTFAEIMSTVKVEMIGDLPSVSQALQTRMNLTGVDREDYKILFIALNGTWMEDLQLRKVSGSWVQALRIQRFNPITKEMETLEYDVRPGYPLKNGEVDWLDSSPATGKPRH